jgi:hypothetical protein
MNSEYFWHLADNQEFWRSQYILQQKNQKEIKRQKRLTAQWYGNSKEYKAEWTQANKRHKSEAAWLSKNENMTQKPQAPP